MLSIHTLQNKCGVYSSMDYNRAKNTVRLQVRFKMFRKQSLLLVRLKIKFSYSFRYYNSLRSLHPAYPR